MSNKTRLVSLEGIQSTQRRLSKSPGGLRKDSRRTKHGHTTPGWEENHLVEVAMEEAMVEAMEKVEAGK